MSASLSSAHAQNGHRLRGIAYRVVAILCFAIMAGAIKIAADRGATTVELVFYRNFFSVPVVLLWMAIGPGFGMIRTKRPKAHLARAGIGLVSMFLNFQAIVMLPLAEATTIGFAAPLFATILSALLLREPVGRHRWAAVAIGFIGVVIVMQPGSTALPIAGLLVAILSALGVAAVVVTLRQIGATEHPATTVFWFNVASLVVISVPMSFVARNYSAEMWAILAIMGITGGLMQIFMTSSLRCAPVSVLAPFDYTQLIWATIIGWLLWSHFPSPATFAGGALIAASGIYTGYREHRLHRRELAAMSTPPVL